MSELTNHHPGERILGRDGQQMPHLASDSRYQNKVAATRVQLPPARNFPLSSLGLFAVRRSSGHFN
jgi:hypothetical protein